MNISSFKLTDRPVHRATSTAKRLFKAGCIALPLAGLLQACVIFQGNGVLETEGRALDGFTAVAANTFLDTTITVGAQFEVAVTCDSNLLDSIETVVEDDTLTISTQDGRAFSSSLSCTTNLVMPSVVGLTNAGSGNLTSGDDLDDIESVANTGFGDLMLTGSARSDGTVTVSNSGSGDTTVSGILVTTLDGSNSGSGNLTVAGVALGASMSNSGSGDIDASEFVTQDVVVDNSGSGDATVRATNSVDVTLSGSGDVIVLGDPTDQTTDETGSGDVLFR